jgi:type II secretory pathway component PulK
MSIEDIFARMERSAAILERLIRWAVALVVLIAGGVLWGARLEWNATQTRQDVDQHEQQLRLHGEHLHALDVTLARKP